MSDLSLKDKTALITGGGSGIGRATAQLFAEKGSRVVIADYRKKAAEETQELITQAGGEARAIECDVTEENDVKAAVDFAVKEFGSLDFAHNNAGVSLDSKPFSEVSKEEFEKVVAVNLTAVFVCMKYELLVMAKQESGGSIVNTASGAAVVPAPGQPHYTATKRGVVGLTTHASDEYKHSKIRVNSVLPGLINTPMLGDWAKGDSKIYKAIMAGVPQHRLADPEEVGEVVVWLCSESARWVSGTSILVDGGMVNR